LRQNQHEIIVDKDSKIWVVVWWLAEEMVRDDAGDRGESKDRVGLVVGVNRSKKIGGGGKICQTDDGATPADYLRIIDEQKLYVYIPAR
jgi:hypothetical protein